MSSVIVELPKPLLARLEKLARLSGVSVSDLLVEAADKMSQVEFLEKVKVQARERDTQSAFEWVLAAVPDAPPDRPEDEIK